VSSKVQILGRDTVSTIVVKNVGDGTVRDVVVADAFVGADRLSDVSAGGTVSGSIVSWKLGALAPGASQTLTVTARRALPGTMSDETTASGYCAEPVSASASTVYKGVPAILVEVVDDLDPVVIGSNTTYTITVTNQGTAPDSDIAVVCELEDSVEYVASGGATQGAVSGKKLTFAPLGTLAPKEAVKWTVTVKGVREGDTRFTVSVNSKETTRPVDETEATRVYK
jgi:uncharacterized repeat protein (TIGR01451 family)